MTAVVLDEPDVELSEASDGLTPALKILMIKVKDAVLAAFTDRSRLCDVRVQRRVGRDFRPVAVDTYPLDALIFVRPRAAETLISIGEVYEEAIASSFADADDVVSLLREAGLVNVRLAPSENEASDQKALVLLDLSNRPAVVFMRNPEYCRVCVVQLDNLTSEVVFDGVPYSTEETFIVSAAADGVIDITTAGPDKELVARLETVEGVYDVACSLYASGLRKIMIGSLMISPSVGRQTLQLIDQMRRSVAKMSPETANLVLRFLSAMPHSENQPVRLNWSDISLIRQVLEVLDNEKDVKYVLDALRQKADTERFPDA